MSTERQTCPKCQGWGEIPCPSCMRKSRRPNRWVLDYWDTCRKCDGEEWLSCDCERGTVLVEEKKPVEETPDVDLERYKVTE